jgi:SGNH domain (fused to AT3 domains)
LYSIHEKTGLGVHLIETPGITFPLNIAEFEPRQVIFNEIMSRAKDGDIILVSRLFIDRTTHTPYSDLPEWGQKISQLASQLNEKGLKLVVVGPPPIFQYEHIESCYFSIFGLNPCVVERFSISSNVNNILSLLNEALRKQKNAYVFDSFEQLCPDSNLTCSPIADNKFLFRDKDHLNTHGAAALTVSFIDFMQKKGLLIEGEGVWNGL